jgi:hypothetical protein
MSKKVAQVIIETLKDAGVEHCYGIVGDTLNASASSLAPAGIKFVHIRHDEAGAIFGLMATWTALADFIGAVDASLALTLGFLLDSLVVFGLLRSVLHRRGAARRA